MVVPNLAVFGILIFLNFPTFQRCCGDGKRWLWKKLVKSFLALTVVFLVGALIIFVYFSLVDPLW